MSAQPVRWTPRARRLGNFLAGSVCVLSFASPFVMWLYDVHV